MTPLNAIINMSELLLEDRTVQKEHHEYLKIIWSSGKILEYNLQSKITQMQVENQ